MHRQHVDDVGPVVTSLVTVAEQSRGDRVGVGPVSDQHAAEVVAGLGVEGREQAAEIGILVDPVPCGLMFAEIAGPITTLAGR